MIDCGDFCLKQTHAHRASRSTYMEPQTLISFHKKVINACKKNSRPHKTGLALEDSDGLRE